MQLQNPFAGSTECIILSNCSSSKLFSWAEMDGLLKKKTSLGRPTHLLVRLNRITDFLRLLFCKLALTTRNSWLRTGSCTG
jgi:hypothetical protein